MNFLNRAANAERGLRTFDQVPTSDALLDIGLSAIVEARSNNPLLPRYAERWRDGLIVAMLACHGARRRTISRLTLGQNIRLDGNGFAVWVSGDDMKAGRPFAFRISSILNDEIREYLRHARILFPGGHDPENGPLWLSFVTRRALAPGGITNAVANLAGKFNSHRTTPHAFRHAAVTTMANAEGFDTRHAQAFLDHRTADIAEQHYNLATQLDAGRAYAKLLERFHRKGGERW